MMMTSSMASSLNLAVGTTSFSTVRPSVSCSDSQYLFVGIINRFSNVSPFDLVDEKVKT